MSDSNSESDPPSSEPNTAVHDFSAIRETLARERTRDRHLLVRMNGAFVGQVISLDESSYTIGRAPGSSIWVLDEGVSRQHARIDKTEDGYFVTDLNSSNGTYVGGEPVERRRLVDGDLLQVGGTAVFRFSHTDVEHEQMLVALYEASVRDPLTGSFNREHFAERLRAEISFARRHQTHVSLVMFDLDHFKSINDTHGHAVGDEVLVLVAKKVTEAIRLEDVFARYGGEEFAVILRNIPLPGAQALAERLREVIASQRVRTAAGAVVQPTASFGCAASTELSKLEPRALVQAADERLLQAKRSGRNRVVA